MQKQIAQRLHAKRRAFERYGIEVSGKGLRSLEADIRNGRAQFVARKTHRISIWRVGLNGAYLVAYDKNRGRIASFLPPDAREA